MSIAHQYRVAAIIPCHNEEVSIATVVTSLQEAVPGMTVFVYDNASTDATKARAAEAGAIVREEPMKGKGNVVRRAFADIDADIYLLIDGDDTYDPFAAPRMIAELVENNLDHVVGVRREVEGGSATGSAYRQGHELGNRVLNGIVAKLFGDSLGDMLSGYRIFSRRFVKSFPAVSREFEIETELTVHSLATRVPATTVSVDFRDRAEGSESKLRTYHDGFRILKVIADLTRHERPIAFYGLISSALALASIVLSAPVLVEWTRSQTVPKMPTLIVAAVLGLAAGLTMVAGLILDGIRKSRHEVSRLTYLRMPSVCATEQSAPTVEAPVAAGAHRPREREQLRSIPGQRRVSEHTVA